MICHGSCYSSIDEANLQCLLSLIRKYFFLELKLLLENKIYVCCGVIPQEACVKRTKEGYLHEDWVSIHFSYLINCTPLPVPHSQELILAFSCLESTVCHSIVIFFLVFLTIIHNSIICHDPINKLCACINPSLL